MKNSKIKYHVIKGIITFVFLVFLGVSLNSLSVLLPSDRIRNNVVASEETFTREGSFPEIIHPYKITIPDNNTDAWMLLIAEYHDNNKSVLDQALSGSYNVYSDVDGLIGSDGIRNIRNNNVKWSGTYARYWHGWLFPLRLLLTFSSYSGIRLINCIICCFMVGVVIFGLSEKSLSGIVFPFIASITILIPIVIPLCMAYMISFTIALIAMILLIYKREFIARVLGLSCLFMIIGQITAYSEFLQFPVITLAFPLVLLIYTEESNLPGRIILILKSSVSWAVGYFGMWISKWIIASLLTDQNVISEAIYQISIRFSATSDMAKDVPISRIKALMENLKAMGQSPLIVMVCILTLYYLIRWFILLLNKRTNTRETAMKFIPYAFIMLIPILWLTGLANHSIIHSHFTYRTASVAVFSWLTALSYISHISIFDKKASMDSLVSFNQNTEMANKNG